MTYNFYCNFCGQKFETTRWDGKTCSHECRSRLGRIQRFSDGNNKLFCTICGNKFESGATKNKTCGEECRGVITDIKVYGMTDEIQEKINKILNKPDENSVLKRITKKDKNNR